MTRWPRSRSARRRSPPTLAVMLIAGAGIFGCGPRLEEVKVTKVYMGSTLEIIALGPDRVRLEAAVAAAFAEVGRLEAMMSLYRPDSDLNRINQAAGGSPVIVSPDLFEIIERALAFSRDSGGAFDITVGSLKGVWSFSPGDPRLGSPAAIAAKLPLIGWKKVELDKARRSVRLPLPGMRIDLGGIAPGYAVDRAIEVLKSHGVTMALINLGGDLRALGRRGARPWQVGLADPRAPDRIIAKIPLENLAATTSGDYERFFIRDGKRYSHILDPKTGAPAHLCASVTVIAKDTVTADALATALFVLGPEPGLALAQKLGVEAVIIDPAGHCRQTPGLAGKIEWSKK